MSNHYEIQWGDDRFCTNIMDTTGNGHLIATVHPGCCPVEQMQFETRRLAQSPAMYEVIKKRHAKLTEWASMLGTGNWPDGDERFEEMKELSAIIAAVKGTT